MGQHLENLDAKMSLLRRHFGGAMVSRDAFEAFMRARTPRQLRAAVERLIAEGLEKIEISKEPFDGDISSAARSLVDMKRLLNEARIPESPANKAIELTALRAAARSQLYPC